MLVSCGPLTVLAELPSHLSTAAGCLLGLATRLLFFYSSQSSNLPYLQSSKDFLEMDLAFKAEEESETSLVAEVMKQMPVHSLTWILPGTRLSEVVNMSCLALDVSGEARITFPVPAPSGLVRMNCCLGDPEASTAVTIWIFCPVCWSVTIYKTQHGGCSHGVSCDLCTCRWCSKC